jgi:hypothetical protein
MAWERVQCPLHLGGLGRVDFDLWGRALHLHWLWLSRMKDAHPWALDPMSDDATTESFFQASISCVIRDGESTCFWLDGRCIGALIPELLAVIPSRAHRQRTVASTLVGHTWIRDITGALMIPMLMQYLTLCQ